MSSTKPAWVRSLVAHFDKNKPRRRVYLQIASLSFVSVVIGLGQACSKGFEVATDPSMLSSASQGTIGGGGNGGTGGGSGGSPGSPQLPPPIQPPANLDIVCKPDQDPTPVRLRRMSNRQYISTMVDITLGLLDYVDRYNVGWYSLSGALAPVMGILPGDVRGKNSFATLDQSLTEFHAFSYFFIASSTADFAVENTGWLNSYGGSCLTPIKDGTAVADTCIDGFVDKFGRVALRKKITADDRAFFKSLYKEFSNSKDGVAAIIQAMLLHPRFTFLVEVDGTPVNGRPDLLQLNDFEIAQRLSFFFLGRTPSTQMLNDAEAGLFTKSEESLKAQLAKYFAIPDNARQAALSGNVYTHPVLQTQLQQNYAQFFDQWLEVGKTAQVPGGAVIDVFAHIYNDPERWTWDTSQTNPYIAGEVHTFTNLITWYQDKKFSDFLTDNTTVFQGSLAKFYGVPHVSGLTQLPDRAGYLTRAAFLMTGDEDTHPILRGAFIRRSLLCDQLPSPNPDALPDRALSPPEANPSWTSRERYAHKTEDVTCQGCHSQINPLAFALEDFDSLARNRHQMFEPVFKVSGQPNGSVKVEVVGKPINNSLVQNLNISSNEVIPQVHGGVELSQVLARSPKANMCFARQVFRHTFGRYETEQDSCMLQEMYANVTAADGSIKRMITSVPLSKHFRLKKIGPN